MKISEMKQSLVGLDAVNFRLPSGEHLPAHFHVTEVGLVSKHFIDCGGVLRARKVGQTVFYALNAEYLPVLQPLLARVTPPLTEPA